MMLTRDLLRYRNRKERIYPTFVKPDDSQLLNLATDLVAAFKDAVGRRLSDLDDDLSGSEWTTHPLLPALKKLLLDRCDEAEDDGAIASARAEMLAAAERLRRETKFESLADFQQAMARLQGQDVTTLQERLYADLPEFKLLKDFKPLEARALLHRYNCAQVQGLLVVAQDVEVTIVSASLAERRSFFRSLKFMRLLSDVVVQDGSGSTTFKMSGPLRIFQNSQSYGLRLAQFFPYVLHLPKWQLKATVKISGKVLELELDHKVGIESHYKKATPYIPPELTSFIATFNERAGGFTAAVGEEYVALGQESYCFPDVTFTSTAGDKVHLEIFHRWHAGQLPHRLQAVEAKADHGLIIGVADELAKSKDTGGILEQSSWFERNGFTFKTMPTPKAVQQLLERHTAATRHTGKTYRVIPPKWAT